MGYFLTYIIKSAICLALLYLPFRLWLRKETFFRINRLGLLGITVLAFLLPILDSSWWTKDAILPEIAITEYESKVLEAAHPSIGWPFIMMGIYLLGCVYFLIRKLRELIRLNLLSVKVACGQVMKTVSISIAMLVQFPLSVG